MAFLAADYGHVSEAEAGITGGTRPTIFADSRSEHSAIASAELLRPRLTGGVPHVLLGPGSRGHDGLQPRLLLVFWSQWALISGQS